MTAESLRQKLLDEKAIYEVDDETFVESWPDGFVESLITIVCEQRQALIGVAHGNIPDGDYRIVTDALAAGDEALRKLGVV